MSFFNPTLPNPAVGNYPGALQFAGSGTNSCHCKDPVDTHYKNFGPRLGAAYRLNDKTDPYRKGLRGRSLDRHREGVQPLFAWAFHSHGNAGQPHRRRARHHLRTLSRRRVLVQIPGLNGIDAISGIIAKFPRARIIVLSTFGGDENIFRAFQAGARAYFLKDIKGQDLVEAIRAVHAGQRVVPPEIASQLAGRVPLTSLSPREMEILILVAKGKSNKEIGAELAISEGTVRVHASNLLSKLRCSGRAQAVSEAIRRGIIEVE